MKIFTKDAVYVHEKDIGFLRSIGYQLPYLVHKHTTEEKTVIGNKYNGYDMYCFFEPEEIEFFKGLDFIVDYYDIKEYTEEEIHGLLCKTLREMDEENNKVPKKDQAFCSCFSRLELLGHKSNSLLKDAINIKKGLVKIDIDDSTIISGNDYDSTGKKLTIHPKGDKNESN